MQARLLLQLLASATLLLVFTAAVAASDKCAICVRLVEAFEAGLRRTVKDNFGGGNTHWEESRLGSYAFSETRLLDIQERLCESEGKEDAALCHAMLEQFEEAIESWWFGEFKSNPTAVGAVAAAALRDLLCVRRAALCCPPGAFGPACAACLACAPASGSCDGNGTRAGSGRCQCQAGYRGDLCAECDTRFYPADSGGSGSQPACLACHPACGPAGCSGGGPDNCRSDCAAGFAPAETYSAPATESGSITCVDVDECTVTSPAPCTGPNERCVNSPGSFACDCEPGNRRADVGNGCVPIETAGIGNKSTETGGESVETGDKSEETGGKSATDNSADAGFKTFDDTGNEKSNEAANSVDKVEL